MNPTAGVIVATNSKVYSKRDALKHLQRFSDVAWILWKEVCSRHPSSLTPGQALKYIIRSCVVNTKSKTVINAVLYQLKLNPRKPWPGYKFDMSTKEGKIGLGIPNGMELGT